MNDVSDKLLANIDDILSKLPFDNSKTAIGLGLHIAIPVLVAYFPFLLAAAPILGQVSVVIASVGAIHKGVKALLATAEAKKDAAV